MRSCIDLNRLLMNIVTNIKYKMTDKGEENL